jgi:hypothetical protein
MKKFLLAFALLIAVSIPVMAQSLFGGVSLLTIITAQTNSSCFYTNAGYIYVPSVGVTNATLSATNSYAGLLQFSVDNGTTWFTNSSGTWYPTNTIGQGYLIPAQSIPYPILMRFLIITNVANTLPIQIAAKTPNL